MSGLDHLWAGWRADFVAGAAEEAGCTPGKAHMHSGTCVFCDILTSGLADEQVHVLWRHSSGRVLAILNAYPYTSGHLMVMPVRHVADLEGLEPGESSDLWEGVQLAVAALKAAYKPDGVNLGANLGRAAGAGVPGTSTCTSCPDGGATRTS